MSTDTIEIKRTVKQIMERIDELEKDVKHWEDVVINSYRVDALLGAKIHLAQSESEIETLYWIIGGKPLPF